MSDPHVRLATASDGPSALALWAALHAEHQAKDERYRLSKDAAQRWLADYREWVRSSNDRVWLAVLADDEPVGLLTAHIYEPAPTYAPTKIVYVDDLYVAVEARGHGLAGQMLSEAKAWGVTHGATQVRAGVLAANAIGRAFWAREGSKDFSVTVTIDLE